MGRARLLLLGVIATAACGKLPLVDVEAGFSLADATWFQEEETLFVFWQVDAQQGLGPESQVEITWRTDDFEQQWSAVSDLPTVHTHVPADCGQNSVCGSISLHVKTPPREVRVRLRYHKEGAMTLEAKVAYSAIAPGPPATNRSLIVYGVFDGSNQRMQWRARHQFPRLRNEQAQSLGLRRHFEIADRRHGDFAPSLAGNPYGYGSESACPSSLEALDASPVATTDRAIFDGVELPLSGSASPVVCARSTVTDGRGTFDAIALARKNPDVAPAFPELRSPVQNDTVVGFILKPCNRTISEAHLAMQKQRLLLEDGPQICIDDWQETGFADQLASQLRQRIDQVRAQGRDMVLVLGLHHDDRSGRLALVVEQALQKILPFERDKSSPRVSGGFVFDTDSHVISDEEIARVVLWCPSTIVGDDLEAIPSLSLRDCALMPDLPELALGPLSFNSLPILPTRKQYETFIEKYSEGQAGRVKSMTFLAPERSALSENVPVGNFGVVTFFNNELVTASQGEVFSFCAKGNEGAERIVFRMAAVPGMQPLATLPDFHDGFPQSSYSLGVAWEFPYLMRLKYEVIVAGAASAFSLSVPFGIATPGSKDYGAALWESGRFPLDQTLLKCARFCSHPTFDTAGVYNVGASFHDAYRDQCYRPKFPAPGEGGFPLDP